MSTPVPRTPIDRDPLQQIVAGLSEGVIVIEPDRTIAWANAAACKMHGVTEVAGLGRTLTEYHQQFQLRYRNHHALTLASYPLERARAREVFSDVIVEVTPAADPDTRWVHRASSLILTNVKGEADLRILFLVDVTDWAGAEQRFEKTFNANPAPAVICRLSDLRYIKVNAGFLEMTGYAREQVIGRSVYELDVLEQVHDRDVAVERLTAGETIVQRQAELRLPGGGTKLVIVAGQPIEMGDDACMLFTFMDLEPRRQAEDALRHSEERFSKAFQMTPVPTLVCAADRLEVTDVNEAFATTIGYAPDELLGRSIEDIGFLDSGNARAQVVGALKKTGALRNAECRIRRKEGETIDCLISAETVRIRDETSFLMTMLDISHRKHTELELVTAIETVMQDASWLSRMLIEKLANARRGHSVDRGDELAKLTARERDVLGLICEGLVDKEIAARLRLAPSTVRNHVAAMYAKLDVHTRTEAVLWARERGVFGKSDRVVQGKRRRRAS